MSKTSIVIISYLFFLHTVNAQPLFELLSAEQTGIDFSNTITDEKEHNILLYSNYYGGAGVGVGDFNNDGLSDLFFAGNLVDDRLFINRGQLKFEDLSHESGIVFNDGWSSSVLVADVNNDGWQDIYVTRELYDDSPVRRKNKLYINSGELIQSESGLLHTKFIERSAQYGLDNSERTRHAVFFDYNNDHLLDLFLLNQPPNPGNYSGFSGMDLLREEWAPRLMKNNGNNQFVDITKEANILLPCYPNSVSASDFNNDGLIDLYIANDYEAPDILWQNKGDGTFENIINESHPHISYYSMGVDAADINNDGMLDIMTLDMVAEDNFRQKSNMSGMNPAAFWKLYNQGGHRQYMYNGLNLNNGNDHFSDIAQLAGVASTDWSWSNLLADFDNDGWKDIHITNGLYRDIRNTDAATAFPVYVKKVISDYLAENPKEGDVSIFDIMDLKEALSIIPSVPLKNYLFTNNGDLTFTNSTKSAGVDQKGFSNGSAYADLDNDGDLEIIVNNINAPAYIYENTSQNNWLRIGLRDDNNRPIFGSKITIKTSLGIQFYEFTNVRGMYSSSENIAHFGLGQSQVIDEILITWPDGQISKINNVNSKQLLEFNWKDSDSDIKELTTSKQTLFNEVESRLSIDFKHMENNFDDFGKQVLLPHKMSQFGPAMATADLNGDDLQDIYIGGAVGQAGAFYFQKQNGLFKESVQMEIKNDSLYEDMDALFLDFDNDGDQDLYVVSGGNAFPPQNKYYQDRLYINESGTFVKASDVLTVFRESGSVVRASDFDMDGDLDLFIGGRHSPWNYPAPTVSRLLINNKGKFEDITKSNAPGLINLGMITDANWSDIDGDQDEDLILVGEWMSPQILLNNNSSFSLVENKLGHYTGWMYSIKSADLDNDGDTDYVVGNLGANYKYKASVTEPFEVHYGDFDESGSKDIVLSYYNYGTRFPLRGRSCSSEQVPDIKSQFPSYDIFASADLETVYGEEDLSAALHYTATDFRSAILVNKGDLFFEIKYLPNEAQLSSINDIIIQDLNQDNIMDLIIAGNLYTSEIETPRNDAGQGLVLLGKGNCDFEAIPSAKSGLYLPKDSKKLKILNTVNGQMLISANNDDYLSIFQYHLLNNN